VALTGPIDLHGRDLRPVRIGDSILHDDNPQILTTLRYNYRPDPSDLGIATTRLNRTKTQNGVELTIRDENSDTYQYQGRLKQTHNDYILLRDEVADGYVLEALNTNIDLQVVDTPWQHDKTILAEQYPRILDSECNQNDSDELVDGIDDADPDNPYDYRNHLAVARKMLSTSVGSPAPSVVNTPNRTPIVGPKRLATYTQVSGQSGTENGLTTPNSDPGAISIVGKSALSSNRVDATKVDSRPSNAAKAFKKTISQQNKSRNKQRLANEVSEDILLGDVSPDDDVATRRGGPSSLPVESKGPISLLSAASSYQNVQHSPVNYITNSSERNGKSHNPLNQASPLVDQESLLRVHQAGDTDDDVETMLLPSPAQRRPVVQPIKKSRKSLAKTESKTGNKIDLPTDINLDIVDNEGDDDLEQDLLRAMQEHDERENLERTTTMVQVEEEEESEEE